MAHLWPRRMRRGGRHAAGPAAALCGWCRRRGGPGAYIIAANTLERPLHLGGRCSAQSAPGRPQLCAAGGGAGGAALRSFTSAPGIGIPALQVVILDVFQAEHFNIFCRDAGIIQVEAMGRCMATAA